ncbi:MAG: ABC transporter permease, partial [Planctomycetota bacterium]
MKITLEALRNGTDRWMNPILLKELRATFRGWKFLAVHLGFLALLSIALVVVILSLSDVARIQPSRIGQGIHQVFLGGIALAIVLILPAFASTALVTEREQNTLELLQTTSLKSRVIVRGKFLASMTYTAVFLFSALPVGVLAFLYGGVTVGNLAVAYACLLALSAITNIFSIFISAQARTSRSALMGTAGFGLV